MLPWYSTWPVHRTSKSFWRHTVHVALRQQSQLSILLHWLCLISSVAELPWCFALHCCRGLCGLTHRCFCWVVVHIWCCGAYTRVSRMDSKCLHKAYLILSSGADKWPWFSMSRLLHVIEMWYLYQCCLCFSLGTCYNTFSAWQGSIFAAQPQLLSCCFIAPMCNLCMLLKHHLKILRATLALGFRALHYRWNSEFLCFLVNSHWCRIAQCL